MATFKSLEQSGWTEKAAAYDGHFASITDQAIVPILDAVGDIAGLDVSAAEPVISRLRLRREEVASLALILPQP